jgi:acetyl-CoA carboxylase biotin carboxyl carrier protein
MKKSGDTGMTTPASSPDMFDVRKIRRLVELMKEHDLNEIDIQQGEVRIQLRRAGNGTNPSAVLPVQAAGGEALPAMQPGAPRPAAASEPAAETRVAVIKSPMVGTFYAAPDPDSSPYVKVGDHVGPETTVCIVEAMKVFNQIPAEISGKILTVLAKNGESVEFGQPLFKVDTRE